MGRRHTLDSRSEVLGRGRPLLLGVRSLPDTEARLLGSSPARRSRRLRELMVVVALGALDRGQNTAIATDSTAVAIWSGSCDFVLQPSKSELRDEATWAKTLNSTHGQFLISFGKYILYRRF